MTRMRHVAAGAWLLVLITAQAAFAQVNDVTAWKAAPAHEASYESVRRRHADLLGTWSYGRLFTELASELDTSTAWPAGDRTRANLVTALREMAARFAGEDAKLAAATDEASKNAIVNTILDTRPTGLFQLVDETWFSGRQFVVTAEEVEALPAARFQDFMHRVTVAERLLREMARPNRAAAVAAIAAAAERWRQYVFDGRSQYPWEMALNGLTTAARSDIQNPPRRQWVLLHPEVGVEMGRGGANGDYVTGKESALVQALGHVWYRWPASAGEELRWWGVSGSVSLREEQRPGVGFTVHYGKVVNVGVLWREVDRNGRRERLPYVHTGVDLFRLARKRLPDWLSKRLADGSAQAAALPASP
ncbi:MAG: hypothetical protein FJW14_01105 [Acidimicrobiia bacterium]|nr:hypothetical protein [Acidimicrobiia bacterium]